jgi:hypothetical protein
VNVTDVSPPCAKVSFASEAEAWRRLFQIALAFGELSLASREDTPTGSGQTGPARLARETFANTRPNNGILVLGERPPVRGRGGGGSSTSKTLSPPLKRVRRG